MSPTSRSLVLKNNKVNSDYLFSLFFKFEQEFELKLFQSPLLSLAIT